jgi:hypothetical protein
MCPYVTPSQLEIIEANTDVTPSQPEIAKANTDKTPSQPENTFKATKSASKAYIDEPPSKPGITKVDVSVTRNVAKQATKYKEQLSSSCETQGCGEPAKLRRPTCIKLNIQGSFFCSQDRFKGNWDQHKALRNHMLAKIQT